MSTVCVHIVLHVTMCTVWREVYIHFSNPPAVTCTVHRINATLNALKRISRTCDDCTMYTSLHSYVVHIATCILQHTSMCYVHYGMQYTSIYTNPKLCTCKSPQTTSIAVNAYTSIVVQGTYISVHTYIYLCSMTICRDPIHSRGGGMTANPPYPAEAVSATKHRITVLNSAMHIDQRYLQNGYVKLLYGYVVACFAVGHVQLFYGYAVAYFVHS